MGATKRGKGLKIMAIVDRHGLPLSVSTHAANHHEVRLVQLCFDFYMIEAKPENLIGDRAYDSDPLDEELRRDGIEMIAPHRSNRTKPPTQDRRRLSRYTQAMVRRAFLRLDTMAASHPRPLGISPPELPRLRPARLPHYPLQTILRSSRPGDQLCPAGFGLARTERLHLGRPSLHLCFPVGLYALGEMAANRCPGTLAPARQLVDATQQNGGAPNNDTLYSRAWVNLKDEPYILSVPEMPDRYYTMEIVDFMGDNFAYVGTRATGTKAGNYAIGGPGWKGTLPGGVKALPPSSTPWISARPRTVSEAYRSGGLTLSPRLGLFRFC